ncbi:2OG-Fe(II) oxygenase family protein [Candidatus Pelagibacter sp.]|uniref:2OG-Fe(II) oxygenase family protein n=1 Tax=Candidatus Pelagibacter sp. TaxID=2024849 RepID=UPI003F856B34
MSINKSLTIQETFNIAVKNHQEGKTDIAKKLYNQVLKIDPNHSQALKNIAIIFINLKDFQKAKECYEKVVEIDPNSTDAYYNLGLIFKELKEYQKAKSCYEKADNIQPNNTIIQTNLGIIFNDLGENQKAKDCYEKAIKINPDNGKAHYNLGAIYKDSGELQKAKICFRKAIEINPNEQEAHNSLGVIFQELGEYQKAKDCYEKAIEIKPNYGDVYYNLGQLLHERGEYHLAENYFKKAIQIKPSDIRASNSLLTNLYKMNNQSILFEELDSIINEGKMNAVIGSICSRSEVKYGVKKENPFCNNPLDYVLKKDLNQKYDFKNVFVKCVNNILKDDSISNRVQKLITNGYQTAGNLFANRDFDTNEIQKIIKIEIEKYRLYFKDSEEGFIKNWPTNYYLNGWLISMKKGGKLSAHMHDLGWLSGSIYINVPKKSDLESGNLVVCIDENENKNENKKSIDVVTGSLCLFPSSLLHYTIPFESEENRIVLAFDMIPNL